MGIDPDNFICKNKYHLSSVAISVAVINLFSAFMRQHMTHDFWITCQLIFQLSQHLKLYSAMNSWLTKHRKRLPNSLLLRVHCRYITQTTPRHIATMKVTADRGDKIVGSDTAIDHSSSTNRFAIRR